MIQKRQFISLADHIKENRSIFGHQQVHSLANWLRTQNSSFNKERWLGYIEGSNGPSGGKVK